MKQMVMILMAVACLQVSTVAQNAYTDSMKSYLAGYVNKHEVVKGEDKAAMHFFDIDSNYRVTAAFNTTANSTWFLMPTSGKIKKMFRLYGTASFILRGTALQLNLYQSQALMGNEAYKDWLFLPFTDATSGITTYAGGRYLDLSLNDIKDGRLVIDFNKAYNPYCAYISNTYNCPLPPAENNLSIIINAGEQLFTKPH